MSTRGGSLACAAAPRWRLLPAHRLHLPQERVAALESQANQIRLQAAQDSERLAAEKSTVLQLLHKVTPGAGAPAQAGGSVASAAHCQPCTCLGQALCPGLPAAAGGWGEVGS